MTTILFNTIYQILSPKAHTFTDRKQITDITVNDILPLINGTCFNQLKNFNIPFSPTECRNISTQALISWASATTSVTWDNILTRQKKNTAFKTNSDRSWLRLYEVEDYRFDGCLPMDSLTCIPPEGTPYNIIIFPIINLKMACDTATCLNNCLAAWTDRFFLSRRHNNKECHIMGMLSVRTPPQHKPSKSSPNPMSMRALHTWLRAHPGYKRDSFSLFEIYAESGKWAIYQHYKRGNAFPTQTHKDALTTYLSTAPAPSISRFHTQSLRTLPLNTLPPLNNFSQPFGFDITCPTQLEHYTRLLAFSLSQYLSETKNNPRLFIEKLGIIPHLNKAIHEPLSIGSPENDFTLMDSTTKS